MVNIQSSLLEQVPQQHILTATHLLPLIDRKFAKDRVGRGRNGKQWQKGKYERKLPSRRPWPLLRPQDIRPSMRGDPDFWEKRAQFCSFLGIYGLPGAASSPKQLHDLQHQGICLLFFIKVPLPLKENWILSTWHSPPFPVQAKCPGQRHMGFPTWRESKVGSLRPQPSPRWQRGIDICLVNYFLVKLHLQLPFFGVPWFIS